MRTKPLPEAFAYGIDIGKKVFHVVALNDAGAVIQRAKFSRDTLMAFFDAAPKVLVPSRRRDLLTCTIMTRAANFAMTELHDRVPVVLNSVNREAWLGGSGELSVAAGVELRHHRVRKFGPNDDGPELIEPIG